jgi:hypothetical protein
MSVESRAHVSVWCHQEIFDLGGGGVCERHYVASAPSGDAVLLRVVGVFGRRGAPLVPAAWLSQAFAEVRLLREVAAMDPVDAIPLDRANPLTGVYALADPIACPGSNRLWPLSDFPADAAHSAMIGFAVVGGAAPCSVGRPLSPNSVADLARQVATALRFLRQHLGRVHTRVSPSAILSVPPRLARATDVPPQLSDSSLPVRLAGLNWSVPADASTVAGGTMPYRAPEAFAFGAIPVGAPADIWALGCSLFELYMGFPLFTFAPPTSGACATCHGQSPDALRVAHGLQAQAVTGEAWPSYLPRLDGPVHAPGCAECLTRVHRPSPRRAISAVIGDVALAGLILGCLRLDPRLRMTAEQVLAHPFLTGFSRRSSI